VSEKPQQNTELIVFS